MMLTVDEKTVVGVNLHVFRVIGEKITPVKDVETAIKLAAFLYDMGIYSYVELFYSDGTTEKLSFDYEDGLPNIPLRILWLKWWEPQND